MADVDELPLPTHWLPLHRDVTPPLRGDGCLHYAADTLAVAVEVTPLRATLRHNNTPYATPARHTEIASYATTIKHMPLKMLRLLILARYGYYMLR